MDSLFEVNVKSVRIKGDTLSLYIYHNNRLILKVRYSEIKSIFKFAVEKMHQLQETPKIKSSSSREKRTLHSERPRFIFFSRDYNYTTLKGGHQEELRWLLGGTRVVFFIFDHFIQLFKRLYM